MEFIFFLAFMIIGSGLNEWKLLSINKLYKTEFFRVQGLVTATGQPLHLFMFLPPSFSDSYLILTLDTPLSFLKEYMYM